MAKQFERDHQKAHRAAVALLETLNSIPLSKPDHRYQACLQILLTYGATGATIHEAVDQVNDTQTVPMEQSETAKPDLPPGA